MTPLALYQAAESGAGTEGARKRWRMACHAMAPLATDAKALALYATACETHKRADWKAAARALATPWGIQNNAKPAPKPERQRREQRRGNASLPCGGLWDETSINQGNLF